MGNCRLYLEKISSRDWSSTDILCRNIVTIIIDGKTYNKSNCKNDSKKIQNLYRIIIRNVDKITYIKYISNKSEIIFYLKNKKLHNLSNAAKTIDGKAITYCIDGEVLSYKDWLVDQKRIVQLREDKLKRIIEN